MEDGVFLAFVDGDIAVEGVVGAFSHVDCEQTQRAETGGFSHVAEVVFECAGFGGAGVAGEEASGYVPGVQRLVHEG